MTSIGTLNKKPRIYMRGSAFTLIELLVVIGIIVMLMGLVIPAVFHAMRSANRSRTEADLHLIETALDAYKQDFSDYPRFDDDNTPKSLNLQQDRGARLLCRALLAPGPAAVSGGGTADFTPGTGQAPDGADGPGFRIRAGGSGKVYGPYIQGDKFKLGNPLATGTNNPNWDNKYFTDAMLLDQNGNPILYYPALPGTPNLAASDGLVCGVANGKPQGSGVQPLSRPLYNSFDNYGYGLTPATGHFYLSDQQLQYIMGADTTTGALAAGKSATYTGPYLLWTAGADGSFGFGVDPATGNPKTYPFTNLKTDDVTNFDIPAGIRK